MSNVNRAQRLQGLIYPPYKTPSFIPNNQSMNTERARRFAAQKLLSGWSPVDVIDYLVIFNYYSLQKARSIVAPLYNRLTTPLKELKESDR